MTQGKSDSGTRAVSSASANGRAESASHQDSPGEVENEARDWKSAHSDLVRLATLRASLDWDEGRSLLAALRFGAHLKLGFGSMFEYVERLFGYRPRLTQEKLRVAEALEELPELDRALRDGVLTWSQYLDLHHVTPRAEGGDHDAEQLVTLCGAHHRAAHVGAISVTGSYSSGFVFKHADGKRYGGAVSPELSELRQKVFLGLKGLGFRETEARRALEAVFASAEGFESVTAEVLLRQSLPVLTGGSKR